MEEKTEELKRLLKENVVIFEYNKKDGSKRVARGTLREDLLPEKEPEEFELDKEGVDALVRESYGNIDEYTGKNRIELVGVSDDGMRYRFRRKKRTVKRNESLVSYYDLEKEEFRSFSKDGFCGIVGIE